MASTTRGQSEPAEHMYDTYNKVPKYLTKSVLDTASCCYQNKTELVVPARRSWTRVFLPCVLMLGGFIEKNK